VDAPASTQEQVTGSFLLATADSVSLLLPLAGINGVEYLEREPEPTEIPGLFADAPAGRRRFIVAPASGLVPLARFPDARFVLTAIDFAGKRVFIAWSEVKVLIDVTFRALPLPCAIADRDSPVQGYVVIGGRPVYVMQQDGLSNFLLGGMGPDD
jgi:hypothetical protein